MIEEIGGAVVVGTAHISPQSVAEVEAAIRERRPARVLVELDPARRKALEDPDAWQKTDLVKVIREGKQHLFLLQLYLAAMQAQMGRETGVAPGTEMLRAIHVAQEVGAEVVLIDRDVSVTLRRGFGAMGFWSRARLFWKVWMEVLTPAAQDKPAPAIEELLKTDAITRMTEDFARFAPAIKVALIDERDDYMASHIRDCVAQGGGVVAVVGAGHMTGIRNRLIGHATLRARSELERPPPPRLTAGKVLGWAIPLLLVAGFIWIGYTADWSSLRDEILFYVLMTGGFAALGAAIAFAHPWSIATAFIAAPITVLHPLLAAGWFAGLAEAKLRTPTVADFQAVKKIETMGQFWRNGVVRILLVTALANLGAMVGSGVVGVRLFQALSGG